MQRQLERRKKEAIIGLAVMGHYAARPRTLSEPLVFNLRKVGIHCRVLNRRGTGSLWLWSWDSTVGVQEGSRESREEGMFKSRREPIAADQSRAVAGKL